MADRGKFITLEGIEGTGKTTQCGRLCDYLRAHDIDVVETREPGGTSLGESIRGLLLSPNADGPSTQSELLLFLAARSQLVTEVILPALGDGKWVVSDRFSDATVAYQGYGRGIDVEVVKSLNEYATGGLRPDRTILFDLDVETGIERALAGKGEFPGSGDGDRMEKEAIDFHQRVREGYLEIAKQEPGRIKVISVADTIDEIHKTVVSWIEPFFARAK